MIRLLEMLRRGLNRRCATKRKVGFCPIKYKKSVLKGSLAEIEQLHYVIVLISQNGMLGLCDGSRPSFLVLAGNFSTLHTQLSKSNYLILSPFSALLKEGQLLPASPGRNRKQAGMSNARPAKIAINV
jgi:hypothetical protein